MGQIFQNFIAGNQAGREEGEARRRQNALEQAGSAYGAGDTEGAENALMSAGLVNEAGAYSSLAEARRNRTNRTAASTAVAALGPEATPQARMQAASGAYMDAGDFDHGAELYNTYSQMNENERQQVQQNFQFLGQQTDRLRALPVEQRGQAAMASIQGTPYDTPQLRAEIERLNGADGITDGDLDGFEQQLLTFQERLGIRREDARYAVQDRQFNQQLAISRQNAAYARNPDSAPVSDSQRRGLTNDYNRAVSGAMDDLGILRPSLPYARLAVTNGGDTSGINGVNVRSSDVALLRAAARAQTGPGVLTESEVFSTLSPSLQQSLIRNVAYLDISSEGITAQDRLALSQFVMQSARNVQRDVWDVYQQASTDWGSRGNAPTFQAPRIPHPEDEGRLQSAERGGAQVGREYVANNGRTYTFLGPGSWELSRMDGRPDQSLPWQPNAERAAQTQTQTPAGGGGGGRSAPAAPAVGTVVDGFRFRGGDPNNQNNWVDTRREQPGAYRGR